MKKKRKLTQTQLQYRKQRKRLQSFIRSAKKRGYEFPENIIPNIPKRITKSSVSRLEKLTVDELYKKAKYKTETGKYISGLKRREQERRERALKSARTKVIKKRPTIDYIPIFDVIQKINERLYEIERKTYPYINLDGKKSELIRIFEDTVTYYEEDKENLINYLYKNEYEIATLLYTIEWESQDMNLINASFVRLGRLLNVTTLSPSQLEYLSEMNDNFAEYED